jgi:hypothetical protein
MTSTDALRDQLIQWLQLAQDRTQLTRLGELAAKQPRETTLVLLGATTVLFYLAERHHNEHVNDMFDAMEYCTSSLSVGYTDVYPQTPLGKVIGSLLMTVGPSLVTNLLPQAIETPPPNDTQQEMLATLKAILAKLEERDAR